MTVEVRNLTGFDIDKIILGKIARKILKSEKKAGYAVSVVFVNKREIKTLNKIYRKKNCPTDILSFGLDIGPRIYVTERYLGELVICPEKIKENSFRFKNTFRNELKLIFIHGLLHLLGYDHEKGVRKALAMQTKQDRYYAAFLQ